MENIAFAQQIAEINRVAANNAWNVVTLIQNQTERNVRNLIEQGNGIVEEGQRIIEEWTNEFNKGRQAIQNVLAESQVTLEQLFAPIVPPKETAKTKKAK